MKNKQNFLAILLIASIISIIFPLQETFAITFEADNLDASTAVNGEGTSGTVRGDFDPQPSLAIVNIYIDDTTEGAFSSISDEDTNTWVLIRSATNGNQNLRSYYTINPTINADNTITVTFTSATDWALDIHTYQGVDTASVVDHSAEATGTDANPTVTFSSTGSISLLLFIYGQSNTGKSPTYGTNQNDRGNIIQGGGEKTAFGNSNEIVTVSGSNDQSVTISKTGAWVAIAIEINSILFKSLTETVNISDSISTVPASIAISVTQGSDDAEQCTATVTLTSSDLEFLEDVSLCGGIMQTVGMRFQDIQIPQGDTIIEASIQFTVDEVNPDVAITVTIQADDRDNAPTFTDVGNPNSNITSRTLTTASVSWSIPDWPTAQVTGSDQRTTDITSVIQEIVNRDNWVSGNSIVIIISEGSGTGIRIAESFDDAAAGEEPTLFVTFRVTDGGPPPVTATDTPSITDSANIVFARTVTDTPSITDSTSEINHYARTATDTSSLTDSYLLEISVIDTPSIIDSASTDASFVRTTTDTPTITDSTSEINHYARTVTDTPSITDSASAVQTHNPISATDTPSITDNGVKTFTRTATDTPTLTDSATTDASFVRIVTDTPTITDSATKDASFVRTPTDTPSLTDSANIVFARTATDTPTITDSTSEINHYARTATDTPSITDSATTDASFVRTPTDTPSLTDSANIVFARTATDTPTITDSVEVGITMFEPSGKYIWFNCTPASNNTVGCIFAFECPAGQFIKGINENGMVICAAP